MCSHHLVHAFQPALRKRELAATRDSALAEQHANLDAGLLSCIQSLLSRLATIKVPPPARGRCWLRELGPLTESHTLVEQYT